MINHNSRLHILELWSTLKIVDLPLFALRALSLELCPHTTNLLSLYDAMFGINRNGLCNKRIML